jgi:polyphosphate kinase
VAEAAAAGKHAAIRLKVNNLSDTAIIDELYLASQAGAKIDLIVRSVCTLRPGVKGMSETIRVRSVLGRFLEHSRVFHFEARRERRYYIGSADLLPRNLDHRLEAVVPGVWPPRSMRCWRTIRPGSSSPTVPGSAGSRRRTTNHGPGRRRSCAPRGAGVARAA